MADTGPTDPLSITQEHIVPFSKGGSDVKGNVTFTHQICNRIKGNEILTLWLRQYCREKVRQYLSGELICYSIFSSTADWPRSIRLPAP